MTVQLFISIVYGQRPGSASTPGVGQMERIQCRQKPTSSSGWGKHAHVLTLLGKEWTLSVPVLVATTEAKHPLPA